MSLLVALALGIVQALTEFLPVSSTAHLLVFGELLGQSLSDDRFRAFVTIIQTGTTLAVIVFFRVELWKLITAALSGLARGRPLATAEARLAWLIVLGTVPAAVAGKLLERRIEALGNMVIAFSLVVWGLVLLAAERFASHRRTISDVALGDALAIGAGQAMALVPGTSRSGATITTGMALGLRREDAARFSFLLSVPITLGAGLYKLRKVLPALSGHPDWANATLVGTAVSLVAGYVVIGWLLSYLRTRTTYVFVAWRILAGALIAIMLWRGILPSSDDVAPRPSGSTAQEPPIPRGSAPGRGERGQAYTAQEPPIPRGSAPDRGERGQAYTAREPSIPHGSAPDRGERGQAYTAQEPPIPRERPPDLRRGQEPR